MQSCDADRPAERWEPALPPWRTTESGAVRRVGVEIEMIGPGVAEVAELLAASLGGRQRPVSRYEIGVEAADGSGWRVELDLEYLKEKGRAQADAAGPPSTVVEWAEDVVRIGAEAFVPVEVVSPPIPIPELRRVQDLVDELRELGARGTRSALVYAFGMQLNVELPRRDAATVLAYLRAFLCLYDWLARESRVDLARKLTRYVAPFPTEYARRVVDPSYPPDLTRIIDDYLEANPTRNRALDLLPALVELDEGRVRRVVTDPRVKPRPALHYRLPNSEIDDPEWGIHLAWRNWLHVERLAADPPRLEAVCGAYAAFLDRSLSRWFGTWADEVETWLTPTDDR